jgi:hypothetical protein
MDCMDYMRSLPDNAFELARESKALKAQLQASKLKAEEQSRGRVGVAA